jgi:hypothetical protein
VDADGDEGGSRSFTVFSDKGKVEYESGASFEHEIARAGHYPESRSANKGNEPEADEVARFGSRKVLFVGSERADVVGVYDLGGHKPEFRQLLPTGIGPEGIKPIPSRNLVAITAEVDSADEGFAVRPLLTVFRLEPGDPDYPYASTSRGSPRGPRAASGWRARAGRTPAASGRTCWSGSTPTATSSRASSCRPRWSRVPPAAASRASP